MSDAPPTTARPWRVTRYTEYFGVREPVVEVARRLGIPYRVLRQRLYYLGWSEAAAFCTPVGRRDGREFAPWGTCEHCDRRRNRGIAAATASRKKKDLRKKREKRDGVSP